MLTGKFWITPHGVIDVSASEHEIYARRWICRISDAEACEFPSLCRVFSVATPEELIVFRHRGADAEALAIMQQEGADLRPLMLRKFGWIRVRENAFWLQETTPAALKLLRSRAYWREQAKVVACDAVDIVELKTSTSRPTTVEKLLNGKLSWKELFHATK